MRHGAHICVDMQNMFSKGSEWHAPWMERVLPAVSELAARFADRTIFTRFVPAETPQSAPGAWRRVYAHWPGMTLDRLHPEMIELVPELARHVPPALVLDKHTYSPWHDGRLHRLLLERNVSALLISGGETDICVLSTLLGAIDLGYRVVLPEDALFGSADETHDAILTLYRNRFRQQLTVCKTDDAIHFWEDIAA
jgi:nicotinamidase-related amidase